MVRGTNRYDETRDELLEQARRAPVARRSRPLYSNLGFELLGHALAAAAGSTYAAVLEQRLARPLGLASIYVPATDAELRPTALHGTSRRGAARAPWTGEGLAPAGGVRATIADLGGLLRAILDGSAPGTAALDPVAEFAGPMHIGAGWLTHDTGKGADRRRITWHNGGTGGFRSFVGLDRDRGTGVAVVSPRSIAVDHHGRDLLRSLG